MLFGIDVDVGEMASIRSPLPIKRRAILVDRLLHIYVENVKKNSMCSSNKCDRAENVLWIWHESIWFSFPEAREWVGPSIEYSSVVIEWMS